MNIQRDKIQQLLVAELGQLQFRTAFEQVLDERLLRFDQPVNPVLDRAGRDDDACRVEPDEFVSVTDEV